MTTLLEKWQQKPTWQNCFTLVPLYQSRLTGFVDLSLREVLHREETWTFDEKEISGFSEINTMPAIFPGIYFTEPVHVPDSITEICQDLLTILRHVFEHLWDAHVPHIFYASGGRDSRILLWILRNLMREGMDLGDFFITCHEPEQKEFTAAMREMGFPEQYWGVRKADQLTAPDYYEVPPISHDCNAFSGPQVTLYQSCFKENESCLVMGSFGGELTDYPVYRNERSSFGQFLKYGVYPRVHYCEMYANWGDVLFPYLSYQYMNYIFHIPQKFFVATGDAAINGGDLLRDTMLDLLGNTAPVFYRHSYNKQLSHVTKARIQTEYETSNLVQYFNHNQQITSARPANEIFDQWRPHSKLYGLASVFEGLHENKVQTVNVTREWRIEQEKQLGEKWEADRLKRLVDFKRRDAEHPPSEDHYGDV